MTVLRIKKCNGPSSPRLGLAFGSGFFQKVASVVCNLGDCTRLLLLLLLRSFFFLFPKCLLNLFRIVKSKITMFFIHFAYELFL